VESLSKTIIRHTRVLVACVCRGQHARAVQQKADPSADVSGQHCNILRPGSQLWATSAGVLDSRWQTSGLLPTQGEYSLWCRCHCQKCEHVDRPNGSCTVFWNSTVRVGALTGAGSSASASRSGEWLNVLRLAHRLSTARSDQRALSFP
jgi:hypothetical protein